MSRLQEIRDKYALGSVYPLNAGGDVERSLFHEAIKDLRFLLDELTPTPIVFEAMVVPHKGCGDAQYFWMANDTNVPKGRYRVTLEPM